VVLTAERFQFPSSRGVSSLCLLDAAFVGFRVGEQLSRVSEQRQLFAARRNLFEMLKVGLGASDAGAGFPPMRAVRDSELSALALARHAHIVPRAAWSWY
jgi:hypothetical protein